MLAEGQCIVPERIPSGDKVRAALDELLGWPGIAKSPQLADLLRYVVEKTLAGDSASIKAYSIAVDVFGRPQSFDPQTDPIVRVQARRLRALIDEFYASGSSGAGVRIVLPLGRYVPEFRVAGGEDGAFGSADAPAGVPDGGERPPDSLRRFLINAAFALAFTLAGVALAAVIVRGMMPPNPSVVSAIPDKPRVDVGPFDNLTGEPALDGEMATLHAQVTDLLDRFDTLDRAAGGLVVTGALQSSGGQLVLRAALTQPTTNSVVWMSSIEGPAGLTGGAALAEIGKILAARLGNSTGPVQAPGRAWLSQQTAPLQQVNLYVCELTYMRWRDSRRLEDAEAGLACLDKVLAGTPDDAVALASMAGMRAWRTQFLSRVGDNISELMNGDLAASGRAVTLAPDSSFVHEQQAIVLSRQGSIDAALGAIEKAHQLNPASMDAVSVYGTLLFVDGKYAQAAAFSEESLATIPTAPAWYHMTRAFNALREQRFFDAIEAAQAVASGDEEFGPLIALASAPRAGRQDLIDRYRPMVMGNSRFQAEGILPRIAMRVSQPGLLQMLRAGLVLAGIPVNALDRPFNADGSERPPANL